MKRYSIIQDWTDEKKCIVCETTQNLHIHEVFFGTSNRQNSIKYGLCVCLCARHHNAGNEGVHRNRVLDLKLKKHAQQKAMDHYGWAVEQFISIIGKSYL